MTTITLTGIKLNYEFQQVVAVSPTQAVLTVDSANTTFSYSITGSEPFPEVDIDATLIQAILDNQLLSDLEARTTINASLGTVTWSGGTTTALSLSWETGPDSDTDLVFVLDGAPLPNITTPAQWNLFDDSITFAGAATGLLAPGTPIRWTEFDSISVTEDDEFYGTVVRDVFFGGKGDDYFQSSPGNDTFNGGTGSFDQVSYAFDPNGVVANLATGRAKDGFGNTDKLVSIEVLRGSAFADRLIGDSGANTIRGLGGDDILNGGTGRDTVRYDRDFNAGGTAGVTVNLSTGTATDGFGDTDTLSGFENVRGSDQRDVLTGSNGANTLQGLNGNDRLDGLGGRDTLIGDNGKDRLNGGGGDDSLTGGAQGDRFVFQGKFGDDRITDFQTAGRIEKIDLSGVASIRSFNDLRNNHLSDVAGVAVIDDGKGNTITLDGLTSADLGANDFLF